MQYELYYTSRLTVSLKVFVYYVNLDVTVSLVTFKLAKVHSHIILSFPQRNSKKQTIILSVLLQQSKFVKYSVFL